MTNIEGLDAELMQRRLAVEEHDVAVDEMTLDHVTKLQLLRNLHAVTVAQIPEMPAASQNTGTQQ